MESSSLYSEESEIAAFLKIFFGVFAAGMIILAFLLVPKDNEAFAPLIISAVLMIVIFALFRKLRIVLYSDYLEVGFSIFRKKYKYSEIVSVESTKVKFFSNIGMHTDLMGGWSFITKYGPAVKIRTVKGNICVFSSDNPELIMSVLESKTRK